MTAWSLPLWAASPPAPNGKRVVFPQLALAQTSPSPNLSATTTPVAPVQGRFEPAPTPNLDIDAPPTVTSSGAVVAPTMLGQKATYRGEGFVQGSSPQVVQQSRHMSLPGISLRVPLN